ncbi:MAG: DNA-binding protein [Nitrososphaera sp.]|jgi:programmed cell death protein 5
MSSDNSSDERKPNDAEVAALKDHALRTLLSPEARLRLNNVRMVKPDLAALVENYLLGLASQGRLNSQISDEQLKQILLSAQQPKRDFKINRR